MIRRLWTGDNVSHHGRHFTVENARLYSRPDAPPPLLRGPRTADLAGQVADGMIGTDPSADAIHRFQRAGGAGKPRYAELTVCWARRESVARRTAREVWPTAAMESSLSWELPLPAHFEAVAELVTGDAVSESVICGPDPERYLAGLAAYAEAGYDHVCLHQVGPDQAGFMRFFLRELLPRVRSVLTG